MHASSVLKTRPNSDKGAIKTTPFSVDAKASKRDEGLKGQNAGDVRLYVEKIETSGPGPRIVARGGKVRPRSRVT